MIDKLVLRCDFHKVGYPARWPNFHLVELGVPLEQSVNRDGQVFRTRHPWESIPSSYESMAFKIFDNRYDGLDQFYIEIQASPAKLMLGHNVFGSDDFYDCCQTLIDLLCTTYPELVPYLDFDSWCLRHIDITYSSRAKDDREARAFINALGNVSFGQTKSRTGYDGTAYFGKKNSRLKKIKVYLKPAEVKETIRRNVSKPDGELLNEVYTPELLDYSTALIRWEVSLYHRYFERLGISLRLDDIFHNNSFAPNHLQTYWQLATLDLFTALKGQTMKIVKDTDIQDQLRAKFAKVGKTGKVSTALADAAFRTYREIRRDGWSVVIDLMTTSSGQRGTFNRHVKMLTECGLSRAALQNMNGLNDGADIIPFVRFIEVDFGAQFPGWYQPEPPRHVYQRAPLLRLVA